MGQLKYVIPMVQKKLLILTSPPASGKTYWIQSLQAIWDERLLVISPLRALANECIEKNGHTTDFMTPEEWMGKKVQRRVVIIDEFHLFFYWGDTFRPVMWEAFFEISQMADLIILLTATLSLEMREEMRAFSLHFDEIHWIDRGNQTLKYLPVRYIRAFSKMWLLEEIKRSKKNGTVKLIFCKFRNEVYELEKELTSLGFECLSCVGGEAGEMAAKLKIHPHPDFIICTTVLSHGVNLPEIQKIFFTYPLRNIDFWIQMVARGGRRGEKYQVYALEKPYDVKYSRIKNLLFLFLLTMRQKLSLRSLFPGKFDFG